ncbi:sphingolipid homeostasis protein orm1 [Coemansia sp. S17]|nr:sphingolipid homeostasis protein orm1 [Coemansia sp. S17]
MFHGIIGTPFEVNQGAYDNLTLWEQMDNGEQYTPTKKFLTVVPIVVFLLSTHYTYYDVPTFIINFTAVLIVLIAKLPAFHRVRFFGINMGQNDYN